jgi:hypothetical protein
VAGVVDPSSDCDSGGHAAPGLVPALSPSVILPGGLGADLVTRRARLRFQRNLVEKCSAQVRQALGIGGGRVRFDIFLSVPSADTVAISCLRIARVGASCPEHAQILSALPAAVSEQIPLDYEDHLQFPVVFRLSVYLPPSDPVACSPPSPAALPPCPEFLPDGGRVWSDCRFEPAGPNGPPPCPASIAEAAFTAARSRLGEFYESGTVPPWSRDMDDDFVRVPSWSERDHFFNFIDPSDTFSSWERYREADFAFLASRQGSTYSVSLQRVQTWARKALVERAVPADLSKKFVSTGAADDDPAECSGVVALRGF